MGDIWLAARANNVARVKHFLDQGVSPNVTRWVSHVSIDGEFHREAEESGVSPLHRAAEVNSFQTAQILIKAGASINARTAWGWFAPLHLACKNGHEQVAEVLLRAGAKWTILTKRLQTPYELAVAAGLNIEALKIQGISRKVAEERRILQTKVPEDAVLIKSRRMSHAYLRKQSQLQLQSAQHHQYKKSLVVSPNEKSALPSESGPPNDTLNTSVPLGEVSRQKMNTAEVEGSQRAGVTREGRNAGSCTARAGGQGDRKGLRSPPSVLTAIADEPDESFNN